MKFHHLLITHADGEWVSLHPTREAAVDVLAKHAEDHWFDVFHPHVPVPADKQARIAEYFEAIGRHQNESFKLTEGELPDAFFFTDRELATVLAALRYWQRDIAARQFLSVPEDDIANEGGKLQALDVGEIDELAERLNATGAER